MNLAGSWLGWDSLLQFGRSILDLGRSLLSGALELENGRLGDHENGGVLVERWLLVLLSWLLQKDNTRTTSGREVRRLVVAHGKLLLRLSLSEKDNTRSILFLAHEIRWLRKHGNGLYLVLVLLLPLISMMISSSLKCESDWNDLLRVFLVIFESSLIEGATFGVESAWSAVPVVSAENEERRVLLRLGSDA